MEAEARPGSMTDPKTPPSDNSSDRLPSSSTDDLEKALDVDVPNDGQLSAEDPRPGAKAGLSLTQFWIVMLGFVIPSLSPPPGNGYLTKDRC
jgi:hypothetical protein